LIETCLSPDQADGDDVKQTRLAVLGSTGSVGRQTLEVAAHHPERFRVVALAAGKQREVLEAQVARFLPELIVADSTDPISGNEVLPTPEGLIAAATHPDVDIVVVATSGHDAIPAILAAIHAGKIIALANKEAMVCAGELIMPLARDLEVEIRTVDSEHSAIWQALGSRSASEAKRLILTASGGPFRSSTLDELANVTIEQALAHPNFSMGGKITVDSATLMNKGLEVIEAHWLFDMPFDRIDVIIHPQQIVHSMVEFEDTSILAQIGTPDMRLPIQYALTYPDHIESPCEPVDFMQIAALTFEPPDEQRFPALRIAREAGIAGDTYPTVLSAADDVAVSSFLTGQIAFPAIARLVETILSMHNPLPIRDLETITEAASWARREAQSLLSSYA